jgi:tetraacyldisaccharide 4'-kinase
VQQLLKERIPPDVILLDDAFQHRSITPGFSILLIDYNHPPDKDWLLPAGRLREPPGSRKRADIILVTRSPERIKPIEMRQYVHNLGLQLGQHLFFTCMVYDRIYPVFDIPDPLDLARLKAQKPAILIVTGIADPRGLRKFARNISTNIRSISYPDHHSFSARDAERIAHEFAAMDSKYGLILTTEKDAMRFHALAMPEHLKKVLYQVRIKVKFLNNDTEHFNKQVLNYVTSNKRNSILHKK